MRDCDPRRKEGNPRQLQSVQTGCNWQWEKTKQNSVPCHHALRGWLLGRQYVSSLAHWGQDEVTSLRNTHTHTHALTQSHIHWSDSLSLLQQQAICKYITLSNIEESNKCNPLQTICLSQTHTLHPYLMDNMTCAWFLLL